jgi:signal transduction histidine kinase
MAAHARHLLSGVDRPASSNGSVGGTGSVSPEGAADGHGSSVFQRVWTDRSILLPTVAETPASAGLLTSPEAVPWLIARGEDHGQLVRELGVRSLISVPLLARERTIGALTLIAAESGRRYGPNDLALAEALAARAALAVDNARLYSEAQAAIRARDEFLSIASHELRTPVTGIKGYAQLLLRAHEHNRLESTRLTRSLHAIDDATNRLSTLTQDLLDVSRIRLGQLPLRLQEIELAELVRRVSYRFSDQLPSGLELIVDLQSPIPPVPGDADRLEQVISNLLENAIKYSPDGGAVTIELGCYGDEIMLSVRDTGIGLPGDAAETIFQPFGRAPNAAQRNLPGMGLGLYICRSIVERHGGRVTARSAGEGLGTTIEVTLPYQATLEPPLEPELGPPARSASEALPA